MYEESALRQKLGCLTILISIGVGFYMSSFLWGVGVFIGLNLIIAPIITYFERRI